MNRTATDQSSSMLFYAFVHQETLKNTEGPITKKDNPEKLAI